MEEIKVGEYARTTDGIVGIIENYDNDEYWIKHSDIDVWKCADDVIVKHSKNIIDLIEVGDYVNGYKVIAKSDDEYIEILTDDIEQGELLTQEDIETILTKEQYMKNCYKIPEKSSDIN